MNTPVRLRRPSRRLLLVLTAVLGIPGGLFGRLDAAEPVVLSVLDFRDNGGEQAWSWLSAGMADMLITDLSNAGVSLVDRAVLNEILNEQSLALAGITDDRALEVGRLASADAILTGSYALVTGAAAGELRIDVRVTDVATGTVLGAVSASGSPGAVFSLEARLASGVCGILGVEPPPTLGQTGTVSLPAAIAYYEGLRLQDSGDVDAARLRFEESARLDPLYAKPRYSLEESWQLLRDFRALRQQREVNTLWRRAEALRIRLAADPFISDSDAIMAAYSAGTPTVRTGMPPADDPTIGSCPDPAVCLWNLQITYWEIGSKSAEYFDDKTTEKASLLEIVRLARQAESAWPADPWLPEIVYWEIFAHRWLGDWDPVRTGCERVFVEWPDFRMSWALEDMYETALRELGG